MALARPVNDSLSVGDTLSVVMSSVSTNSRSRIRLTNLVGGCVEWSGGGDCWGCDWVVGV